MGFFNLLVHLFIPRESNNQRAKVLHPSSLGLIAIFLIGFQLVLNVASSTIPQVLGYAANITPSEIIRLTNEERAANGLSAVTENSLLDSAALAKGNDMLAKGYWAHFAPDGTSPWSFFVDFGYKYRYAGENLARDFSDAGSAVDAWMNSPSHKENILNPKYQEVGIGVVEGKLSGVNTTIIVQFFGAPATSAPAIPIVKAEVSVAAPLKEPLSQAFVTTGPSATPPVAATLSPAPNLSSAAASPNYVSPFGSTKNLSMAILGVIILVLSVDLVVVKRKRIARIGGRTLAHIAFLGMILAVILILRAGRII